jgi:hypothetical protein
MINIPGQDQTAIEDLRLPRKQGARSTFCHQGRSGISGPAIRWHGQKGRICDKDGTG